jgi:hypothetical protein
VVDQSNSTNYFSVRGDGQVTVGAGNVGIGTSPSYLLHAKGSSPSIAVEGSTSGNAWRLETSATNNVFNITETGVGSAFSIDAGAPSGIKIDSSGNVGIGTSSPLYQLHQKKTSGNVYHFIETDGVNGYATLLLGNDAQDYHFGVDASDNLNIGTGTDPSTSQLVTVTSAGKVGIGGASNGADLEINNTSNDPFISINGATTGNPYIQFSQNNTQKAYIQYVDSGDVFTFQSDGSYNFTSGNVFIGDTTNANMTQGLTINQGTNDNQIFALKSSDVGHPFTGIVEADTYGDMIKPDPTAGGLHIRGFRDADGDPQEALKLEAFLGEAVNTTKSTAGIGAIAMNVFVTDGGTSVSATASNSNLVSIRDGSAVRFIFDSDGDSHQDVGTAWTNFDNEHDALITRSLGLVMDKASAVKTKWDDWGRDHREDLIRTGIIPNLTQEQINNGERPLVNTTQVMRVHNGALWQLYTQIMDMAERIEENVPQLRGKLIPQIGA